MKQVVLIIFGLIVLLLIICLVYWLCFKKKELEILPFKESLFFQAMDDRGRGGFIHDSGNDPSQRFQKLQVLRKDINENIIIRLSKPQKIAFGTNPSLLNKVIDVSPEDIIETNKLYYLVQLDLDKAKEINKN